MTPRIAFTIGYQGADPTLFVQSLTAAGVTTVLDTRHTPTSRRPAYRREALRERLREHGVAYVSRPALGVPRRIRGLEARRRWLFDAAYRGVLSRAGPELEEAIRLTARETVALLCFEVDPGTCHRGLLADEMTSRAAIMFRHLRPGDGEDADDHPVAVSVVGSDDQVEISAR
jgi:uncharacterized protein (DUF488 family)